MSKPFRRTGKKKILFGIAIIVVIALVVIFFIHRHQHHEKVRQNLAVTHKQTVTGTTSKPTPHQVITPNTNGQGGVKDQNGASTGSLPPSSDWVSSDSGNITLQLPSPNTTVQSGDTLAGLAKVSSVQFVLSDDSVGQIAQGNLNVVNGKFSGQLQFTPHAKTGKLEVYYPDPSNGAEKDIIEINVKFNVQ